MKRILEYKGWYIISIAVFSGASSVLLGAFGAHTLRDLINDTTFRSFQKGVEYQFIHTLALLFVGLYVGVLPSKIYGEQLLRYAVVFFMLGIVLFSGSLYLITILHAIDERVSMPIFVTLLTPCGGVFFVMAWLLMAVYMLKYYRKNIN